MLYKAVALAALIAVAIGQNETTTTTAAPTPPTLSPTRKPSRSPTTSPTRAPTIDLGGDEVVIEVDVTLIGADVMNQCKGDGFKKAFRKSYKSGLLSIYSSSVGATDDQVEDKFIDGCKTTTATTEGDFAVDTSIYGSDGITVSFKLSSKDADVLNTFEKRWKATFVSSFTQQVYLLFDNPVTVDYDKTTERESAKGTLSRKSDIASDGEKFGSIWLLPGIMLMIAGCVFAYQTRSIIDPDGVEDNDRADRLRGERAKFEREFGPLNPDDADGDMVSHDLPPPEQVRAVEMEVVGSSSDIREGGSAATGGTKKTTSGGAGETKGKDTKDIKKADMKVKKTEKAPATKEAAPEKKETAKATTDKSKTTGSTAKAGETAAAGAAVTAAAAATTSESGETATKKKDDPKPQPVPEKAKEVPKKEPVKKPVEEPVAEEPAAEDEPEEDTTDEVDDAATGAPASVVATAKGHGAQPSGSESFDPAKFATKEEAQAATQTYLDNLWDDADGDALPDGDEDGDSSADYA